MYFTHLSTLRNSSEFDFQTLSLYKKLALVRLRSIRSQVDLTAWTSFKMLAAIDPRILFVCGESEDDPIDRLVQELWTALGKRIADEDEGSPAIAVIDVADIVAQGAQLVTPKWVRIEPETDHGPLHAGEDAIWSQYSSEGYAIIDAVTRARETASEPIKIPALLKVLSRLWAVVSATRPLS